MSKTDKIKSGHKSITKYALIMGSVWTLLIVVIMMLSIREEIRNAQKFVKNEARVHFLKDRVFRNWGALHGGVYVPPTTHTPPNPNLAHLPDRDIVTTAGKKLTLMNPAYMMRQLMDDYEEQYGVKGRITSLKPLNPNNTPDEWERKALKLFEAGVDEVIEFADIDGKPYLRLMQPMKVTESCLKCHSQQGYAANDIRGGIGVSVLAEPFYAVANEELVEHAITLVLLWLIGLILLIFSTIRLKQKANERDLAASALIESEEKYRGVVEGTDDLITRVDTDGNFSFVNHISKRVLGVEQAQALGLSAFDFVHPDDRDKTEKWFKECLKNQISQSEIENRQVNRETGVSSFMSWTCSFRYCHYGIFQEVDGIARNITDRRQSEKALRENEEKFRTLVESIDIIPWRFSLEKGQFTFIGKQVETILGYSVESWTDLDSWANRIHPDDRETAVNYCMTSTQKCENHDFEYRCVTPSGKIVWLRDIVSVKCDRMGMPNELYGFMIDISETKRLQELESRASRLETAGTIAGQVAHDFNNLLAPMMAYPEFIRDELPDNHPTLKYLEQIEKAAHKIADINQQLLTLGRRGHYNHEPFNLNGIILQAVKDMDLSSTNITCSTDLDPKLKNILGGGSQIHRVITNLLVNAVDAIHSSGQISIKTENYFADNVSGAFGRVPKGEYVKFTITDTGCGITSETSKKILDPFFTTKITDQQRGSGLGLSVVDSVVKDHNGYLDLETKLYEGTSFYIYFPITEKPVTTVKSVVSNGGKETILVVDDDEIQREVSSQLLMRLGYEVNSVENGEKAVGFIKEMPQNLILLDMVMPGGIDGAETYQRILKINPNQRVIIVSGFSETDRVQIAMQLGAGAFVKKPLSKQVIADAIRLELDRAEKVLI